MYEGNGEFKHGDFRKRPKRTDRSAFGLEFVNTMLNCFMRYGLDSQIEYDEYNPVDFVWEYLSLGLECKRLKKTEYVTQAWLKAHVVDRFSEQEKIMGKPIRNRILVTTEKKWEKALDYWLASKGIWIIETGQIDNKLQEFESGLVFMNAFENIVWAICNKQKVRMLEEMN